MCSHWGSCRVEWCSPSSLQRPTSTRDAIIIHVPSYDVFCPARRKRNLLQIVRSVPHTSFMHDVLFYFDFLCSLQKPTLLCFCCQTETSQNYFVTYWKVEILSSDLSSGILVAVPTSYFHSKPQHSNSSSIVSFLRCTNIPFSRETPGGRPTWVPPPSVARQLHCVQLQPCITRSIGIHSVSSSLLGETACIIIFPNHKS